MRAEEIEEMRHLPLFAGVAAEHVERMLRSSFLQRFPGRIDLAREGDPADFLHVVVEGQVEVYSGYRDRETTVAVLNAGASFILAAVLLDRVYLKSARTLAPSRILLLSAEAVRDAFAADAAFARILASEVALAYRNVVKELKNQKLRSSLERLANWILSQDAAQGRTGRVEIPFDKKVLASRLGMAPEVLSRSFASLAPYGTTVDGAVLRISSRSDLEKLAQPSPTIDDPAS